MYLHAIPTSKIETGPGQNQELRFVDYGSDSDVYFDGQDLVYKLYNRPFTTDLIRGYQRVTNKLSALLESSPYFVRLRFLGEQKDARLLVNPISEVRENSEGTPIAISEYIPGISLADLLYQGKPDEVIDLQNFLGKRMSGIEERRLFLRAIRRAYTVNQSPLVLHDDELVSISEHMNVRAGVKGIDLYSRNIKAGLEPGTANLRLIVTDLANGLYHYPIEATGCS